MNKTCNRCGETKPIEDFYKNPNVIGGRVHQCKECVKSRVKVYMQVNKDKLKLGRKERYWNNRESSIRKSVEWGRKNKDKRKIVKKRWANGNKLYTAVINKNLNAKKQGAEGSFTLDEYVNKLSEFNNKCGYCFTGDAYTVDHIVPISKGGTNYINNIMPACLKCNGQKRDYLLVDWLKLSNCYNKNIKLLDL